MHQWIVLFRGINVGGNNIVSMKRLVEMLQNMGCQQVKTYIQSGNVVLEHVLSDERALALLICEQLTKCFGFNVNIMLLDLELFRQAARQNPFPVAGNEGKCLHLYFLSAQPVNADLAGLVANKVDSESYQIIDKVFYLHAPDGIGRSKLAAKAEKLLGVSTTARNWNTVNNILKLSEEYAE
jgi:uncharacterized protein (DUF1697 family)